MNTHQISLKSATIDIIPTDHSKVLGTALIVIGVVTILLTLAFEELLPENLVWLSIIHLLIGIALSIKPTYSLNTELNTIRTVFHLFSIPIYITKGTFDFATVKSLLIRDKDEYYLNHYYKNGYRNSDGYSTSKFIEQSIKIVTNDNYELHLFNALKSDNSLNDYTFLSECLEATLDYEPSKANTENHSYFTLLTSTILIFITEAVVLYLIQIF